MSETSAAIPAQWKGMKFRDNYNVKVTNTKQCVTVNKTKVYNCEENVVKSLVVNTKYFQDCTMKNVHQWPI